MQAVFKKALRDSRRIILWLSIGLGLYGLMMMGIYPDMLENKEQFDELIAEYPEELMNTFASGIDMSVVSFTDPDVFLHMYFTTFMVLIIGGFLIAQAFNAVTNAERDGTMDVMMSLPISRRNMLLGRIANTIVVTLMIITACFLVFAVSMQFTEGFDVSMGDLILAFYSAFFILMAQAMFTYMLATLVPSSRRWAGPVAYAIFFGSYLVFGFAGNSDVIDSLKPVLLFNYYNASSIIREGVDLIDWLVLGGAALVFGSIAWWRIDEKELAV
jgi:ABC-2 type transport system permease protein